MHEENAKNDIAAQKRWYKLLNWAVHVAKIEQHFLSVCDRAKEEAFFENLYVSRDDDRRQIQLFAGQHPIGNVEVTRDAFGRETGRRLQIEHGAALVISQSMLGEVAVILYPYSSEQVRQAQDYIIWSVFTDPTQITETVLKKITRDFFRYIRVSSALFTESGLDRLRIRYLEFRGRKYVGGGGFAKLVFSHWSWVVLGAIGSVASIYSLWK